MILRFFDTTKTNEFADWIVAEIQRAGAPNEELRANTKKKHAIRAQGINKNIVQRVAEFSRTTRLNVYKKASFAARVREGLTNHGYSPEFVRSFALDLIELIERAKTAEKKRPDSLTI